MIQFFSNLLPVASVVTTAIVSTSPPSTGSLSTNTNTTFNSDQHLLDPYACIARLAQLSFQPEHTLLEFCENSILFHLPDSHQSLKRTLLNARGYHSSQWHLKYLRVPIEQAAQTYVESEHDLVFRLAYRGLCLLERTYRSKNDGVTADAIDLYKLLVDRRLNSVHSSTTTTMSVPISIVTNRTKPEPTISTVSPPYVSTVWHDHDYDIIRNLLQTIDEHHSVTASTHARTIRDAHLQTLDNILKAKEHEFRKQIFHLLNTFNMNVVSNTTSSTKSYNNSG